MSQVPLAQESGVLDVNPITNIIYATEPSFNMIHAINGSTGSIIANITNNSDEPTAVAVNPVTNKIYVTNYPCHGNGNSVSVINGSTNTVIKVIPTCYYPQGFALNPVTNKIYETCEHMTNSVYLQATELIVIDGSTDTVTASINPTPCAGQIGVNTNTNTIYIGGSSRTCVMNGDVNIFTGIILGPAGSYGVNSKTNRIYDADYYGNQVFVINGTTNQVVSSISTANPQAISLNQNTNMIYVGNYAGNSRGTITAIDGSR